MRKFRLAAATGLFVLSAGANAAVTSTWTLASDYDFRDITQSAQDPALQASVDYVHDSGWYIGGWASNIDLKESDGTREDVFSTEARVVLTVANTFPWQ